MVDNSLHTQRRSFLKVGATIAAGGSLGLAGCLGGDNDRTTVSVSTAEGSSASELLAALQRVVSNESDEVQITVQEAPGDPANIRLYNDGDVDGYTCSNWTAFLANNDRGDFEERPVDELASQGIQIATYGLHWVALQDSGIETVDDLGGHDVFPLPPAFGFRQLIKSAHEEHGSWDGIEDNAVNLSLSDVPGAVDEGRVEGMVAYITNDKGLVSFMREVDSRADLQFVDFTDDFISAIENADGANYGQTEVVGYEQDMGTDSVDSIIEAAQLFLGEDVPDEAAHEIARISHEYNDEIIAGFDQYLDHTNLENMNQNWVDFLPVHPGVADFLEENDHWDGDSWDRAE